MIAGLSIRWKRLRYGWRVRWAHHPLCQRHAHETWRVGGLFLCKGCVCLAAGLGLASVAVLVLPGAWSAWALLLTAPPVFSLSWPPFYQRLPRGFRDLLRVGAGASIVFAAAVVGHWPLLAWPLLPALAALWWGFRRARASVIARRCIGCPELGAGKICSGYARQAASTRAFELAIEAGMVEQLVGCDGLPPALRRATRQ